MNPLPFAQRSTLLSDKKHTESTADVRIRPIPGMADKPKRPRTAYNLFFKDQQAKSTAMRQAGAVTTRQGSQDMSSFISECWKNISPSQRMYYNQLAVEDKFRYYREKAEYRERMDRGQQQDLLRSSNSNSNSNSNSSSSSSSSSNNNNNNNNNNNKNIGAFKHIYMDKSTSKSLAGPLQSCRRQDEKHKDGANDLTPFPFYYFGEQNQRRNQIHVPENPPLLVPDRRIQVTDQAGIANLASKLDPASIAFLIRAFK